MAKIKVAVSLTVTVDTDAWDLAYDTGTDPAAVRKDVRAHLAEVLPGLPVWKEVNGGVTVAGS